MRDCEALRCLRRSTTSRRKVPLSSPPSARQAYQAMVVRGFCGKPRRPARLQQVDLAHRVVSALNAATGSQRPCVASSDSAVSLRGLFQTGTARSLVLGQCLERRLPAIQPDGSRRSAASGPATLTADVHAATCPATGPLRAGMRVWGVFGRFGTGDQAKARLAVVRP